ncbi:MAG TPA: PHB depolymerase family esterase [Fimbriiglobus sp.]|nr:PHB depolymerase family esterase [Fimbriiglobus sp.]
MESVSVTVAGVERRYLLARAGSDAHRPVVVFLHGTGGTAAWADGETGWSAFAGRAGFTLAIPEGLPPDSARPPKFLTNPQRWTEGPEDVEFLAAVIADVLDQTDGDPRRVYLSGFSNGAAMAFRFATERSDLLAAVAPVAGYCRVADPRPSRPVPTLYVIGTADPLVPLHGGQVRLPWGGRVVRRGPVVESLEAWASALGCAPVPEVVSDTGGVREEVYPGPVEYRAVFVEGLGHHWPGGKGQLNPRIGGQPSNKLNANELIWGFFSRHVL